MHEISLTMINNQVLIKMKIAVRISSQKGCKYDKNMRYLMFSKTTQHTSKNFPLNYSLYDVKSVVCGNSKKSLSLKRYGLFLINACGCCSHGKGVSRWAAVLQNVLEPSMLHNEYSTISESKCIH